MEAATLPTLKRIYIIEYGRGIAALSVAWFHLTNQYPMGLIRFSGSYGWLGVEVFFVLSGFVIPYSISQIRPYYRVADFPRFMLRRIIRLEPPYLISVIMVVVLTSLSALTPGFGGPEPHWEPGALAAHLFYIVPLTRFSWLQPVYWSLAYEFVFYITIGLLYNLIGCDSSNASFLTYITVVIFMCLFGVIPSICLLFVMGVVLFRSTLESEIFKKIICHLVILLIALFMVAASDPATPFIGVLTASAIGLAMSGQLYGVTHRILVWLGTISYSLYLIHVPIGGRIVNIGRRAASNEWEYLALSIAALLISISISWIFYRLVEQPAHKWSRSIIKPTI